MSYFNELPFNDVSENIYEPLSELILFIEKHNEYYADKSLINVIYKYLGIYLQMIYCQVYSIKSIRTKIHYSDKNIVSDYNIDSKFTYYIHLSDIRDENGNTLLHQFALLGYYELVEMALTKYKIDPNINNNGIDYDTDRDDPGKSALMCVVELDWNEEHKQKYLDICVLLVKNNSDWTKIFRLLFWGFAYCIYIKIKKDDNINHIEKNIIILMDVLKKMNLIDINILCVSCISKKFGRLTDPERFGRRFYFYNIEKPIYPNSKKVTTYSDSKIYNVNKPNYIFNLNKTNNKTILFLSILSKNKQLTYWLIHNGAEMENYIEYEKLQKDYIENIRKEYLYYRRKPLLETTYCFNNIKYLSDPYILREISSYL